MMLPRSEKRAKLQKDLVHGHDDKTVNMPI